MSQLQPLVAVLGGLITLAVIAGGLWAVARSSSQDARIKRLQDERDDYRNRLDWIEPRHKELEQKNKLLMDLHNPTARLEALDAQESQHHAQTVALLTDMGRLLHQIDDKLPHGGAA